MSNPKFSHFPKGYKGRRRHLHCLPGSFLFPKPQITTLWESRRKNQKLNEANGLQNEKPYCASSHSGYHGSSPTGTVKAMWSCSKNLPFWVAGLFKGRRPKAFPDQDESVSPLPIAKVMFVILDFLHFKDYPCTSFRSIKLTNFTEH